MSFEEDYGLNKPRAVNQLTKLSDDFAEGVAARTTRSRGRPRPRVRCPWSQTAQTRRLNQIRTLLQTLPRGHVAVYERDGIVSGVFTIDSPRVMLMGRRAISGRLSSREFLGRIT